MASLGKQPKLVSNFIQKMYQILSDSQYEQIIGWSSEGNSFIIHNISLFQTIILPKYFKHSNTSSFFRHLIMYDFHKVPFPKNQNEQKYQFNNQHFLKGHCELLCKIKRRKNDIPVPIQKHNQIQQNNELINTENQLPNTLNGQGKQKIQNCEEIARQTLEDLKTTQNNLKLIKDKQEAYLKKISSVNQIFNCQKFYKLTTSLLSEKVKGSMLQCPQKAKEEKEWPNSFDEVIQHIISDEKPKIFEQYQSCARKLFNKHDDENFMLKKTPRAQ